MARMAQPDEPNWIQNSLAGDTEAYAAIVKEHQKMVHAVAFRMTGSLADAEDLTQETFLRAFRQIDSFRGESKFSTWLCQIAVNLGLNWCARENRRDDIHFPTNFRAGCKTRWTNFRPNSVRPSC